MNMDWITVQEAGKLWGVTTRRAQFLCAKGKVDGAQKLGNFWVIPKDTPKPIDGRTKSAKTLKNKRSLDVALTERYVKPTMQGKTAMLSIEEIRTLVIPVIKKYPIDRVILFGSHARGEANTTSDVDLIVDSRGRLCNRKIFALGGELLGVLPVRVDVYDILEIENPSAMYDNIRNEGVVIYESAR